MTTDKDMPWVLLFDDHGGFKWVNIRDLIVFKPEQYKVTIKNIRKRMFAYWFID